MVSREITATITNHQSGMSPTRIMMFLKTLYMQPAMQGPVRLPSSDCLPKQRASVAHHLPEWWGGHGIVLENKKQRLFPVSAIVDCSTVFSPTASF